MSEQRYDVTYFPNHTTVEPHFCRDWDDSGGCYGTNPDHGYSFDDACDQVAEWYEQQAAMWRSREHPDCLYYIEHSAVLQPATDSEAAK
jgi:hypothetical protein